MTTVTSANSTPLTVLAQAYTNAAQLSEQVENDEATGLIQRQLKQKIAALPNTADDALVQSTQADVTRVTTQLNAINSYNNGNFQNSLTLGDLDKQLESLQTAITNQDSAGFDAALSEVQIDVSNLVALTPTAPYQPDQILGLKGTGLGIQSSASYDLSTAAGQTAAQTAVNNAQSQINQISAIVTSNQLVGGDVSTALTTQVNSLNQTLNQAKNTSASNTAAQTAQLTQLANDQEHLIQLSLGNTTELSTSIANMEAQLVATPVTSPLAVLLNAVGETATTATTALNSPSPAILSLLA